MASFEHGSWQRFGETWPTGLPRLMTVDDLSAHATHDKEEDDVPVVLDEEEGFGDTSVDNGSESTTDLDHDNAEDDVNNVLVVSDDDDVGEVWADDF
jgi:hypothetical protein